MKGYSGFLKAAALLEPHHQIVLYHIQDTRGKVLTLYRDVVGVLYGPSQQGQIILRTSGVSCCSRKPLVIFEPNLLFNP